MSESVDNPAEFEERRKQTIWERLDEVGQECAAGHKRVRTRLEELEKQADAIGDGCKALTERVSLLEHAPPPDVSKLRFSTGVMVAIMGVTITVVGSAYGLSNRVMNRLDTFEERINRQSETDKTDRANSAKLLEERYLRSEKQFEAFGRQMELLKYEQQRLREDVTQKRGSSR